MADNHSAAATSDEKGEEKGTGSPSTETTLAYENEETVIAGMDVEIDGVTPIKKEEEKDEKEEKMEESKDSTFDVEDPNIYVIMRETGLGPSEAALAYSVCGSVFQAIAVAKEMRHLSKEKIVHFEVDETRPMRLAETRHEYTWHESTPDEETRSTLGAEATMLGAASSTGSGTGGAAGSSTGGTAGSSSGSGTGGGASAKTTSIELIPLKTGVYFRDWVPAACLRLRSSTASHDIKTGEVMEALMEHPPLLQEVINQKTSAPAKKVIDIIEGMRRGEFGDYIKKVKRTANWPKFTAKDTIRSYTVAFRMEMKDSGRDDEEARSAYVCGLNGTPRTIATMKVTSSPLISFEDLAAYLIATLESRETEADLNMLDAMTDRPGQTVEEYARAVLEEATRVLSAHGYSDEQIRSRAHQIFVRNLRGAVGDKLRDLFPETWDKAILLARNIESKMAKEPATLAAAAPSATSSSSSSSSSSFRPQGGAQGKKDKSKELCGYCKKPGHYKRECRALQRKKEAEETAKKNPSSKNGSAGATALP